MPALGHSYDDLPLPDRMRALADQADEQHLRDWADQVEALEAEVERLREALRDITVRQNALAQAEAEIARLREALAEAAEDLDAAGSQVAARRAYQAAMHGLNDSDAR